MASISINPSKYFSNKDNVVAHADFENGFNLSWSGNVCTFSGSWICPTEAEPVSNNLICAGPEDGNCAALQLSITSNSGTATIKGTLSVSSPTTPLNETGLANAMTKNGGLTTIPPHTDKAQWFSYPYLLGSLNGF